MTKENRKSEISFACTSGRDGSAPDTIGGSEGTTCGFWRVDGKTQDGKDVSRTEAPEI